MPAVDGDWRHQAACSSPDAPNLDFFSDDPRMQLSCAVLCRAACPVVRQCLGYALGNEEAVGVWGSLSPGDLRRTLGVDEDGDTYDWGLPLSCPACGSDDVRIARKRRIRVDVACEACDFTWERRRIVRSRTANNRAG